MTSKPIRKFSLLIALGLGLELGVTPVASAQIPLAPSYPAPAAPSVTAPAPAPPPAAPGPMQDIGWPRQVTRDGATLVYYQPQLDAWKDYKALSCRMAFSLTPRGGKPILGVASLTASTLVDNAARTVFLRDIKVSSVRFPSAEPQSVAQLEALVRGLVPSGGEPIALDRLLAMVEQDKLVAQSVPVNNDPPVVFYSATPAILLIVEGEPVLAPVDKTELSFVVNTNWDVFFDKSSKDYFLLGPTGWLTAKAFGGPWTSTRTLPKGMTALPAGQNFDDVKKMVPAPAPSAAAPPQVFYSNKPAELILLRGAPVYSKVPGTQLLYVTNSDGDIFVDNASRQFYVLLSGRWFRAATLGGPFVFASQSLPPDFAKIPASSPKAHVLASVPGTQAAADAVMLAQVPTTAVINKAQAEAAAKVTYDGPPKFVPITSTAMLYATNTDEKVIKLGELYYLCFQGVWFMSTTPNGPWQVVGEVPAAIYTIPPSSPVYNVTYVTQTNATSTTVECSHTSGYYGMFVVGFAFGATVAYGTGYYYPPYYYYPPGFYYPVYRPWPRTYGVAAVYNPRTGGYAVGRGVYGPYGAAQSAAWYNPATGRYGRSASVQTPYGGRTAASAYNPWTGSYARTQQGHNAYSQWGSSVATRGNQWVQTGHVTTAGGTTAAYRTSTGEQGVIKHGANGTVARTDSGVYAGKDGNVYKRDGKGNWSQYQQGGWNKVDHSASQVQGLDSSAHSRERGQHEVQRRQYSGAGAGAGAGGGAFHGGARGGGGGGRRR